MLAQYRQSQRQSRRRCSQVTVRMGDKSSICRPCLELRDQVHLMRDGKIGAQQQPACLRHSRRKQRPATAQCTVQSRPHLRRDWPLWLTSEALVAGMSGSATPSARLAGSCFGPWAAALPLRFRVVLQPCGAARVPLCSSNVHDALSATGAAPSAPGLSSGASRSSCTRIRTSKPPRVALSCLRGQRGAMSALHHEEMQNLVTVHRTAAH